MADMPPTIAPRQDARQAIERLRDRRRRQEQKWRGWYDLRIWRHVIRPRELSAHPLCVMCEAMGVVTAATVVDHVGGHRGDWERFINGPFQSLCKTHHDSVAQAEEFENRGKDNG